MANYRFLIHFLSKKPHVFLPKKILKLKKFKMEVIEIDQH